MARTSIPVRNMKRMKLVEKYAKKRESLKKRISNPSSHQDQQIAERLLQKMPRDSNKIRVRKRCWLTQRSRGVYSPFGLSRHMIRLLMSKGLIPGLQKSSW